MSASDDEDPLDVLQRRLLAPGRLIPGPVDSESDVHGPQRVDLSFPVPVTAVAVAAAVANESDIGVHIRVALLVDPSPGCGGRAWPAGEVLARYLASTKAATLPGATVIELGSGTGLVGLVAARLGARVWLTDQAPMLDIMRTNVKLNNLADSVNVEEYNWGAPAPPGLPPRADFVLAADCVYAEPAFPLLVATLRDLAGPDPARAPEMLFCCKKRRKADKRFFTLLKKHFEWKQVDDDPDAAAYARDAVSLIRLVPRPRK